MKQWLLRAETVFEEAASEEPLETGSIQSEPRAASDADDEDMYGPAVPGTSKDTHEGSPRSSPISPGKNTNIHVPLLGAEGDEQSTTGAADHNNIRFESFREEEITNSSKSQTSVEPATPASSSVTLSKQLKHIDYDWFDFFLKAGIYSHLSEKYSKTMLREGLDESSQKNLTAEKLRGIGLATNDVYKVMNSLEQKFGKPPVDKSVESDFAVASPELSRTDTPSVMIVAPEVALDVAPEIDKSISSTLQANTPILSSPQASTDETQIKSTASSFPLALPRPANIKRVSVAKGSGDRPDSDALVAGASTAVSQPSSPRSMDRAAGTLLTQTSTSSIATTTNTSDAQKTMDLAKAKSNSGGSGGEVKKYRRGFERRSKGDESAEKQVSKTDSAIQSEEVRPTPARIREVSQVEKSITHLLVATKQLLETLAQWSRKQASEEEVSDVYVRLGYEFNLSCRAFNSLGVDTADLGPVPDLLRTLLEDTLSQAASPQALDNYLPRIRDVIINLLQGLKRKQRMLRVDEEAA
jgi:hypothetical protein